MYNYRKYIAVALTVEKSWKFSPFNGVLIYKFINELVEYWNRNSAESSVNALQIEI